MKRKFMLSILLLLSFAMAGCKDVEETPLECSSDEVLYNNECYSDPLICEDVLGIEDSCFEIQGGSCIEVTVTCDEGDILDDTGCACEPGPYAEYETFMHDGLTRYYQVYIPEILEDDAPIIFSLHGLTSNPKANQVLTHFNDIADREGFIVVYPYGTLVDGVSHWDAKLDYAEVDEVGFLEALALYIQETYQASEEHTFITGFSNGGFMSYEVACQSDTFKAAAPVAGLMSLETYNTCQGNPIPILHIHGAVDSIVPIDAVMEVPGGWGGGPTTDGIIDYWVSINNTTNVELSDLGTTTIEKYTSSESDIQVWYYLVMDYDHIWPGAIDYYTPVQSETAGFDASELIWEFFSEYID